MKLTKKLKRDWLKALKSGKYIQCTGKLQKSENEYCCLAVLCEVANIRHGDKACLDKNGNEISYDPLKTILGKHAQEIWEKNDESFDHAHPDYSNVIPLIKQLKPTR